MTAPEIAGLTYLELLGSGGYSDVYLYEQQTPRRRVAVKILKSGQIDDSELAQFAAEAQTMAGLADHPNIVQVFATGALDDGRPYLVMQYYPGANLAERSATARMSVPDALRIGVKIASAVETAHRAGILHRDIKPANILVSPYGEPGLTDFGIAGHVADTDSDDDVGVSVPWAPPEVLTAASNGSVAADVYSLGATVWHLIGGRSPFEVPGGDNRPAGLMSRIVRTAPPSTGRADVPASLERLLAQAMSKTPATRPCSAAQFARELQMIEQEQRFARTELVIAGLDFGSSAPRPDGADHADNTRFKAPSRVVPQPPQPSRFRPRIEQQDDLRTSSRDAPGPLISGMPNGSSLPSSGRPEAPRTRTLADAAEAPATSLRPARPEPAPAPVQRQRGLRTGWVVAAAVAVAVAAVVVGLLLVSEGEDAPTTTPRTQAQTQKPDDPIAAGATADPPTVTATYDAADKRVTFTFTTTRVKGDSFFWFPTGDPQAGKPTDTAAVTLAAANPRTVCIQVEQVFADRTSSLASTSVCGR